MTIPYQASWLVPSAPGQLCNVLAPAGLKARYISPAGASDTVGSIRVQAVRTVVAGATSQSQTTWDSSWVGTPATSNVLSNAPMGSDSVVTYNGRAYALLNTPGPFGLNTV